MNKILITGAAGFIGFTLSRKLLQLGVEVVGIDNLNSYYDVSLKQSRLDILKKFLNFKFYKSDIANREELDNIFKEQQPHRVVNLAAQAGVRYSFTNPFAYVESNLVGFVNVIEACRCHSVEHLIYASTSSVYGLSTKLPFSVHEDADHPVSLYGATKRANELIAHSYSHISGIPTTGLRFFTVYGPWGRPDMALFLFTKNILEGKPIDVFNEGHHKRDFTYVEDIVEGLFRIIESKPPQPDQNWNTKVCDPATSSAPFKIYNIGNNRSIELMRYIEVLEKNLGKTALKNFCPIQKGDIATTHANVDDLSRDFDYHPSTSIETGIEKFVAWYRGYYKV